MARSRPRTKQPLEYSLIYTATLCLLALGAIMVYSASSAESLLEGSGDPSYYLKRYVALAIIGIVVLHFASRHGLSVVKAVTPMLLLAGFVLTALGLACVLLMKQPDMGTTMVICFTLGTVLFVAGTPVRLLGTIGGALG